MTRSGVNGRLGASTVMLALMALLSLRSVATLAQPADPPPALVYDAQTRGPVPIPPSERGLQTVVAEPWFKVSDAGLVLEGPAFDRGGNLLFCDVSGRRVLRLTPDRRLSTLVSLDQLGPGGIAVHKDGRIFIAALDLARGVGAVVAAEPGGSGMRTIVPPGSGYMPNDLVFDARGGFYFTDFRGASTDPKGGVYYVSPDFGAITPVLPRLAMANGVALSPAPDSMRADADGNLYVAVYGQGRVLAFNRNGIPIGQVLLPGREEGHNLRSTNLAIRPGTDDLYVVTSDGEGGQGATIFHARGFAKALPLYSHQ